MTQSTILAGSGEYSSSMPVVPSKVSRTQASFQRGANQVPGWRLALKPVVLGLTLGCDGQRDGRHFAEPGSFLRLQVIQPQRLLRQDPFDVASKLQHLAPPQGLT